MDDTNDFIPVVLDDTPLFKSTHTCPYSGGYCLKSCAFALIFREEKETWVCGKALDNANEDFLAQGVTWDYS